MPDDERLLLAERMDQPDDIADQSAFAFFRRVQPNAVHVNHSMLNHVYGPMRLVIFER